jgi:hypothetical protein
MLTATLWCLATGLLWTFVGIYFTALNRRGCDALGLNLISALFLALISLAMVPWPEVLAETAPEARLADLSIAMLLAGGTMAAGLVLMMAAMRRGPADVAWSVCQSSMVIPFSLGALLNHSPVQALNVAGLGAVAAGIALFGRRTAAPRPDPTGRGGYAVAILAFLVIGLGQYLFSIPSYWEGWRDGHRLRIPIQVVGGFAVLLLLAIPTGRIALEGRLWKHGFLFACLTFASRHALYAAMDALAALGQAPITYPVCLGLSILGYVAWHAWTQRRPDAVTMAIAALLSAGLVMLGRR